MASLTTRELITQGAGAGGLATRAARWALVFAWAMGSAKRLIDGEFGISVPALPLAYTMVLAAVLLLTRQEDRPLPGRPAALVCMLALTAVSLALLAQPTTPPYWMIHFSSHVIALLFVRGNGRTGLVGVLAHTLIVIMWAGATGQTPGVLSAALLAPLVAYVGGITWQLTLRRIVAKERAHRFEAAESEMQARAEREAAEHSRQELELVRSKTEHVLTRISDGAHLDGEVRTQIAVIEGEIRDRIRSPRLQHHELMRAVAQARAGGTSVTVLADDSPGAPMLDERTAYRLATVIRHAADADSIVIAWSEPEQVSVVSRTGERSERQTIDIELGHEAV